MTLDELKDLLFIQLPAELQAFKDEVHKQDPLKTFKNQVDFQKHTDTLIRLEKSLPEHFIGPLELLRRAITALASAKNPWTGSVTDLETLLENIHQAIEGVKAVMKP